MSVPQNLLKTLAKGMKSPKGNNVKFVCLDDGTERMLYASETILSERNDYFKTSNINFE